MNSTTLRLSALTAIAIATATAYACWDPDYLPQDYLTYQVIEKEYSNSHYYVGYNGNERTDRAKYVSPRKQMVNIWQSQLLPGIPEREIEALIFDDGQSIDEIRDLKVNAPLRKLLTANDNQLLDYVLTMREVAEIRNQLNDPWYYCYQGDPQVVRLKELADESLAKVDGPLGDRYAIQAARALLTLREYEQLLNLAETHKFDDKYLEYQMEGYKASALCKYERYEEALEIYQRHKDTLSIEWVLDKLGKNDSPLSVWYEMSKDPSNYVMVCKGLESYMESRELDHEFQGWEESAYRPGEMGAVIETARRGAALNNALKPVWQYTEAYAYILTNNDFARADSVLRRIKGAKPFLQDQIRALRFNTLAAIKPYGPEYHQWLVQECNWLISKGDDIYKEKTKKRNRYDDDDYYDDYDYYRGINYMIWSRNGHHSTIYYSDVMHRAIDTSVVPRMLEHGDTIMALQMLDIVDFCNLGTPTSVDDGEYTHGTPTICSAMEFGPDIIRGAIQSTGAISNLWHRNGSIRNADRWNDLLGTALLSRGRYKEAIPVLSSVGAKYAVGRSTGEFYTHRNPFSATFIADPECHQSATEMKARPTYYKLWFAQQMAALEDKMANTKLSADARADAQVKYGVGMINSVYPCWSLTQYGYGSTPFMPYANPHEVPYPWADKENTADYIDSFFCYGNDTHYGWDITQLMRPYYDQLYRLKLRGEDLVNDGLAKLTDREKHAAWLREMGKYSKIKADFADTKTGLQLKAACDNWGDWK